MVAAAIIARPRATTPPPARTVSVKRSRRPLGSWVIIGVPVLLVLTFAWQVGSNLLRTEIAIREAVAVSRVSLEADPAGSRIDLVLVDRIGLETTVNGQLTLKLREPDGTVWQVTRNVTAADFVPIQSGGLLAGRLGYSVVIPSADWLRAPRRGGAASISVNVQRADGAAFSTVAEERFP
jgi:hypothetical protein